MARVVPRRRRVQVSAPDPARASTSAGASAAAPILERVSFDVAPGEFVGDHGTQRRRQEHAARHRRRPAAADGGRGRARRSPARASGRRSSARGWSRTCRRACAPIWRCTPRRSCLMGRYAHADRWFESDEDRRIADEAMERCDCLEFRRPRARHAERRRAPARLPGRVPRAAGRACCCSTSRRRFSTSISSCSASRPARRGRSRHRVPRRDARRQPRADVLHAADRPRRSTASRAICRPTPRSTIPRGSACSPSRLSVGPGGRRRARPWVRYQ